MGAQGDSVRGRPRRAETDERIVAATLELIREQGPEAVNVASVAARSGIARTTIYRRYRDRSDLLQAALQPAVERGEPPQGASVRDKLAWVLARTQEVLAGSIGRGGVAAVVADNDPDFSAALRGALQSALEPIHEQIRDDVGQGRLASYVDADLTVNLVLGAYLAELVRYGTPRPDWLHRTADLLAASLGAHAPG
ncbi:TetR/AcrR family transcriptional regulator C-terminal ligand-binding domain-containing protein [Nocardioides pakistanensis]